MMSSKKYLINCALFLIFLSCSDSVEPLADGYTLIGTVLDSRTNKGIDSVQILETTTYDDSLRFVFTGIITDSLGSFIYKTGPATGPSDELFKFERYRYLTKIVELKLAAQKISNYKYKLDVSLNPYIR